LQWQTRPTVEVERAFDHGEAATAPNHAANVIFNTKRITPRDGDADVVALPDLLSGLEA
jgi:hypothetical protein